MILLTELEFLRYLAPTADQMQTLLSIYRQLCVVQYGELTINSPNTVHTFCSGQVGRIKIQIFGARQMKLANHFGHFHTSLLLLIQSCLLDFVT